MFDSVEVSYPCARCGQFDGHAERCLELQVEHERLVEQLEASLELINRSSARPQQ
jgi:hypothetical protein